MGGVTDRQLKKTLIFSLLDIMASTSCASKTAFFIGTILIFFMLRIVNGGGGDYDGGEIMPERRQLRTKHYCVDVDLKARAAPRSL